MHVKPHRITEKARSGEARAPFGLAENYEPRRPIHFYQAQYWYRSVADQGHADAHFGVAAPFVLY